MLKTFTEYFIVKTIDKRFMNEFEFLKDEMIHKAMKL